jgi:hypothetical protein
MRKTISTSFQFARLRYPGGIPDYIKNWYTDYPAMDDGTVLETVQQSAALIYFVVIGSRVHVDEHTVESLAEASAGRVIYIAKTDSVPAALDAIHEELEQQYYVGYYVPRRPGHHRIRVEIPGKTVRIRAKSGYTGLRLD